MDEAQLQNTVEALAERVDKLEKPPPSKTDQFFRYFIYGGVLAAVLFIALSTLMRLILLVDRYDGDADIDASEAERALQRADEAVASVELLLSFLEGASVLLALALGAAAIYGYRQSSDLRQELGEEIDDIRRLRREIEAPLARYQALQDEFNGRFHTMQEQMSTLLQADQQFRLGNYEQSHLLVHQVIEADGMNYDSPQALFIAGWCEVHVHASYKKGRELFNRIKQTHPNWALAEAEAAIALRRYARTLMKENPTLAGELQMQAQVELLSAVRKDPQLVDLNGESYHVPVGGIYRDQGDMENAIKHYEEALTVTPRASYPGGNLAILYLKKSRRTSDPVEARDYLMMARDLFERSSRYAKAEIISKPNDYYYYIEIARSHTVRSYWSEEEDKFYDANRYLILALKMKDADGRLESSVNGWHQILDALDCDSIGPDDDWYPVCQQVLKSITLIQEEAARRANSRG